MWLGGEVGSDVPTVPVAKYYIIVIRAGVHTEHNHTPNFTPGFLILLLWTPADDNCGLVFILLPPDSTVGQATLLFIIISATDVGRGKSYVGIYSGSDLARTLATLEHLYYRDRLPHGTTSGQEPGTKKGYRSTA